MKFILQLIFLLFVLLPEFSLYAQESTILNFLNWDIDPVAVGRGGSAIADGTGLYSIYINPAHLNDVAAWEVAYQNRAIRTNFNWGYFAIAGAYRLNQKNVFGVHWQRMSFGEIVHTDISGNIIDRGTLQDYAIGLTYGRRFSRHLFGGISLKYLRSDLVGAATNGWAFDLGINVRKLFPALTFRFPTKEIPDLKQFKPPEETMGWQLGMALLNAGPQMYYLAPEQKDPIPQLFRLGIAGNVISSLLINVKLLFDFEKMLVHREGFRFGRADAFYEAWFTAWKGQPFKEATYHFGTDIRLAYILNVRFGFQYQPYVDQFDNTILTFGFGIDLKYFSIQYGEWLNRGNSNFLYKDSYVIGIRVGNVKF